MSDKMHPITHQIILALAQKIGLKEAIMLQYLVAYSKQWNEQRVLVHSPRDWLEHFSFWCVLTRKKTLKRLEEKGLLKARPLKMKFHPKYTVYILNLERLQTLYPFSEKGEGYAVSASH